MITEFDLLKSIAKNQKTNGTTNHFDVMKDLNIDDLSLSRFLKLLQYKGYIITDSKSIELTSLGMYAYNSNKSSKRIKKSIFHFSKLTLQRIIDIAIGIIIGVAVAYIVYHFGWQ